MGGIGREGGRGMLWERFEGFREIFKWERIEGRERIFWLDVCKWVICVGEGCVEEGCVGWVGCVGIELWEGLE